MKKTIKQMDMRYDVPNLIQSAFMTDNPNHPLIGATVRFKVTPENRLTLGTLACKCTYELIGTQRCWGYDKDGKYTMVDGFRLIAMEYADKVGRAATEDEFIVITTLN